MHFPRRGDEASHKVPTCIATNKRVGDLRARYDPERPPPNRSSAALRNRLDIV